MERLLLAPGSPLARFVERLWYYRNDPTPHVKERLMPDGCVSIVINLAEDQSRFYDPDDTRKMFTIDGCALSGPRTKSFAIDTGEQNHVVGISFRPAGAVPFLKGFPALNAAFAVSKACSAASRLVGPFGGPMSLSIAAISINLTLSTTSALSPASIPPNTSPTIPASPATTTISPSSRSGSRVSQIFTIPIPQPAP